MPKSSKGSAAYEVEWLLENPEFWERPATIREFLGPNYLNIETRVRKRILYELDTIFGDEVTGHQIARFPLAMITGGIGIGKTTIASIVLPYMVHWVCCLKDPQGFFALLPGSRIAFMQMSTSEKQALEVVFGDIKARIQNSPWFITHFPMDPKFTKEIRFANDVWILPGDSSETTFEGYNILGGILDEADSHKITDKKDYAEQGYDTIRNRIDSRFGDRGFLLVIGQMKAAEGFAARKFNEFRLRPDAYAVTMAIWESFGDDYYRCRKIGPHPQRKDLPDGEQCGEIHKFPYDKRRKLVISESLAAVMGSENENIMWIPDLYMREFEVNPEKALRDLAGVPPAVGDPFISHAYKAEEARDRWILRHWPDVGTSEGLGVRELSELSPIAPDGRVAAWLKPLNSMPRVGHIDIAFSAEGDALGFAMGHVQGVVDIEGEKKPYIVIDLLYRIKAPAGGEIYLQQIRRFIYELRDKYKYKLKKVTMDGFQSTDTKQQLRRRRFETEIVSIDRDLTPYYDLRDALYEDRIEIPPYMVTLNVGGLELVEIAQKELSELIDNGKKIEHPVVNGSKDVADAIAGCVYELMGDRAYRRGVVSLSQRREQREERLAVNAGMSHPAFVGDRGSMKAPIPPSWG